jgi:hypothetical protein
MTQKFKVLSDMLSATAFSFTLLLSAPAFAVPFQVLLERDTDSGPGTEIFLVTYDSFADLLSNDIAASSYSQLNINSDFSVGGMAFDGSAYQLLLERDTDSGPGTEIFLVTYDSFADLLSNDIAASSYSQLNVNSDFSVGGMAAEVQSTAVPEPSTLALFGLGLAGLCGRLHRKAVCRTP